MFSRIFSLNSALALGAILFWLMSVSPSFAKTALIKRAVKTEKEALSKSKRVRLSESSANSIKRKSTTLNNGSKVYSRNAKRVDEDGNGYQRNTNAYKRQDGSQGYRVQQSGKSNDGERWRSVDKYRETSNGGTIQKSRHVSLDSNNNVSYSKDVAGESAAGKQYSGNVSVKDGEVVRKYTCKDATGITVECR